MFLLFQIMRFCSHLFLHSTTRYSCIVSDTVIHTLPILVMYTWPHKIQYTTQFSPELLFLLLQERSKIVENMCSSSQLQPRDLVNYIIEISTSFSHQNIVEELVEHWLLARQAQVRIWVPPQETFFQVCYLLLGVRILILRQQM